MHNMQYTPQDININGADFSNMAQKAPIHLFKFENSEYIQEYNMWNVKELAILRKI